MYDDVASFLKLVDVNTKLNKQAETGLHLACAKGHFTIAKLLLENKANIYVYENLCWETLMEYAIRLL